MSTDHKNLLIAVDCHLILHLSAATKKFIKNETVGGYCKAPLFGEIPFSASSEDDRKILRNIVVYDIFILNWGLLWQKVHIML